MPTLGVAASDHLLMEFRRAAMFVPAYQVVLAEQGVRASDVWDVETFSRVVPVLSKANTFDRFPLADLSVGGRLPDLAGVLTSSGHGGRFSFGVIGREEAASAGAFVDAALDAAFGVKSRKTLALNCLPMGVGIASDCMTVATTSVREDMALALIRTFGGDYEQIVVIADPLFMKRLTDAAAEQAFDWLRYRLHVVIGEETFGEHFRTYVGGCLGLAPDDPNGGRLLSSFGVAELGLHLCFETAATTALVRAMTRRPALARDLLGHCGAEASARSRPMLLAYHPERTFMEIVGADGDGYGALTISMLDPTRSVPLLRYQTGDVARLLDPGHVAAALGAHGLTGLAIPPSLLALKGRVKEALPNGANVALYKDALYADPVVARRVTGATRLFFRDGDLTMHVQLARGQAADAGLEPQIAQTLPSPVRPSRVRLWAYEQFPFGMTLDYERKFPHYVPGEVEPG